MNAPSDDTQDPDSTDSGGSGRQTVTLEVVSDITTIDAESWDACAGDDNPFVGHAFLSALEESGSASRDSGWLPHHMVARDAQGVLIGAVPLYLKGHSWGEYVFDHAWAHAYEQAGGRYYPKLQAAVPFTPVTGPRLLARPGPGQAAIQRMLADGLKTLAEHAGVITLHVTFPTKDEYRLLGEAGYLRRTGIQFHWHNRGYADFDDFLSALSSRKRKNIRKERARVAEQGFTMRALTGDALTSVVWDRFHHFYLDTVDRKWGAAYLRRSFFELLGERLGDKVVLMGAFEGDTMVAAALNLVGGRALYGRNWGAESDFPFLHFETCYYQAIDFAIAHGLDRVEAGAQGPHKISRGYEPVTTYSAHWIRDAGLESAVARYLDQERHEIDAERALLEQHSPFRTKG